MNREDVKRILKIRELVVETYERALDGIGSDEMDTMNVLNCCISKANDSLLDINRTLEGYCNDNRVGNWLLEIRGITPELAAGLLAYFDVRGKECAAQFIRYAGADNHSNPHSNEARRLLNQICFQFKTTPRSLYGSLYYRKYKELMAGGNIASASASIKAERYMIKTFVAHLFEEMYREEHGGELPGRHEMPDRVIVEPEVEYTI